MDNQQVAILIRDALSSFIRARLDSRQYVDSRYPSWTQEQKQEKQRQVEERIEVAEKLFELSSVIAEKIESDLQTLLDPQADDEDVEEGDDACDICGRSGVAVYRTTLDGDTVCEDSECQEEADFRDQVHQSM